MADLKKENKKHIHSINGNKLSRSVSATSRVAQVVHEC